MVDRGVIGFGWLEIWTCNSGGREKAFRIISSRCRCRGGRNGLGGLAKGESLEDGRYVS